MWFFGCHSSFLMKNHCKIMIFEFWKSQKLQKYWFFHGFLQKTKILTSSPRDGQKKKSEVVEMIQKWCLTSFFDVPHFSKKCIFQLFLSNFINFVRFLLFFIFFWTFPLSVWGLPMFLSTRFLITAISCYSGVSCISKANAFRGSQIWVKDVMFLLAKSDSP